MPTAVNFVGGPSCGKGTQGKKLQAVMGKRVHIIQMSSILTLHRSQRVEYHGREEEVGSIMDAGGMVPDDFILRHLSEYFVTTTRSTQGKFVTDVVLDGTMRTRLQAERQMESLLPKYGVTRSVTFHLVCPEEVLRQRFEQRRLIENRSDDRGGDLVFNNRLKEMRENLPRTASYLQGVALTNTRHRFVEINVEQQPDAIHAEIMYHLQSAKLVHA